MLKKIASISFIALFFLSAHVCFAAPLSVSAWIPYWAKTAGASSTISHMQYFNEIHPFAFEVQGDGTIKNTLKLDQSPYKELIAKAKSSGVKVIPTFLWTGPTAMYKIFSDEAKTQKHISDIISLAQSINASGVDIDYEGKRMADKALYAYFFERLSAQLHARNLTLSCTIEAASTAEPSDLLKKMSATSPWSNDLTKLNKYCDVIRLMAYDQMPQTTTSIWTSTTDKKPYAPNADIAWVRKVLAYNLKYIDKNKLVLGIPTYGWDTEYTKLKKGGYSYEIMKSVPFDVGMQVAKDNKVIPQRDSTGGLSFTYTKGTSTRIVYLADATSIQYALEAAQKAGIRGVTFFKIDGDEDQSLWNVLKTFIK